MNQVEESAINSYYNVKIEELEQFLRDKRQNLSRLVAQRNEMNTKGNIPTNILSPPFERRNYQNAGGRVSCRRSC